MIKTKVCSKCGEEKSVEEFSRNKSRKDNLSIWCKICNCEYNKIYYLKNIEKEKERCIKYRKNNSEKIKELSRKQRLKKGYSKRKKIWDKRYREKHKEELKKRKKIYQKRYIEKNPI